MPDTEMLRERNVFPDIPKSGISVPISRDIGDGDAVRLSVQDDGMNLWSVVSGDEASVYSVISDIVIDLQRDGSEKVAAANLKALAEIQQVLRSTSAGIGWEDAISVPAGDLVLLVRMAMRRLS